LTYVPAPVLYAGILGSAGVAQLRGRKLLLLFSVPEHRRRLLFDDVLGYGTALYIAP